MVQPDRPRSWTMGPRRLPHGGPPTALLVRALERAVPGHATGRGFSVDLGRPVPMAGFTIATQVTCAGRATANASVNALLKACFDAFMKSEKKA